MDTNNGRWHGKNDYRFLGFFAVKVGTYRFGKQVVRANAPHGSEAFEARQKFGGERCYHSVSIPERRAIGDIRTVLLANGGIKA